MSLTSNGVSFTSPAKISLAATAADADGTVREHTKEPGKALVTRDAGKRCFSCHANGEPIMNELTDPWTSWVSARTPRATVEGMNVYRLAGGKITEVWTQLDTLGLLQQLGAIPEPE